MTKDDLYKVLAAKGLTAGQSKLLTDGFFRLVIRSLREAKNVSLKNFATFVVKHKNEIQIVNNRTKTRMTIPAHKVVQAKFPKGLKNLQVRDQKARDHKG